MWTERISYFQFLLKLRAPHIIPAACATRCTIKNTWYCKYCAIFLRKSTYHRSSTFPNTQKHQNPWQVPGHGSKPVQKGESRANRQWWLYILVVLVHYHHSPLIPFYPNITRCRCSYLIFFHASHCTHLLRKEKYIPLQPICSPYWPSNYHRLSYPQ